MSESQQAAVVGEEVGEGDAPTREFDLIVYGATGFTGRQAAAYVAAHAPHGLKWAIAGRSGARLEAVRKALECPVQVLVADAQDAVKIDALARRARVVLTTVGPYARFGTALFAACAAAGTHYVDITGETPWVRRMIDVHQATAQASGAVMVPMCGFDSVPSDLGAWMMVDWIRRHWHTGTRSVRTGFKLNGGVNGGTLASAMNMGENPQQQRQMARPFLLDPDPEVVVARAGARHADPLGPWFDADMGASGMWLSPFIMGAVNSRVVRRSAAIHAAAGMPYGADFAYQEGLRVKSRWQGRMMTVGLAGAAVALSTGAGRALVRRFAPAPGEGPTDAQMDGGFFSTELVAEAEDGRKLRGRVKAQGDAGNRNTVKMLCESAFAMCVDRERLPVDGGGVHTPATAFGGVLLARLRAAGMEWTVDEPAGAQA